ncbi:MAG TPA: indolepyruvate oxidoreductase subunit beta family protein [Burkholderiaceae bacterium]|nr:indolepyruvate oxidoreductase subunit beta family protein [Burkholderiaceae bacterium]
MNPPIMMPLRPVTILIAALGGEGGGVLADWLVNAAAACDFPVQSTSIPGVSQRTGATTYYVEIYPVPTCDLGGRLPVMALTPTPGAVDIMAASELAEAGRALQNSYISADSTTLIASTHRIYSVAEKVIPGDGRTDSEKILAALRTGAQRAVLFDMAQLARQSGTMVNAVLFGALCGSGVLPLTRAACEQAIRAAGKSAEASLRGFAAGHAHAAGEAVAAPIAAPAAKETPAERVQRRFPPETFDVINAGVARLTDYQDAAYADLYLTRMEPIIALDREAGGGPGGYQLACETGRLLALWMSYEDIIRVADLKTRKSRFQRLRKEVGARPDETVTVTEYLKPGLEEICSILTPRMAERLRKWAAKNNREKSLSRPLHIKTSTVSGYLLLRGVSWLKPWRRRTSRYQAEQALMDRWLGAIKRLGFAVLDLELAMEIVQCARLTRGYGEAHATGMQNFRKIFDNIIESGKERDPKKLADAIQRARQTAMANPDAAPAHRQSMNADPGKPIFWMPRKTAEQQETEKT